MNPKITEQHRSRPAYIYVRQSTNAQVLHHQESTERQYALRAMALELGWSESASHHNISRVIDVFTDLDGHDVGSVSAEIEKKLAQKKWPEGYTVSMRGAVSSMRESFRGLALGFLLAIVLIYFVIIPLFPTFRDPLISMLAVP